MLRKLTQDASKIEIIDVINRLVDGFIYRQLYQPYHANPTDPQEGMVVWADGTNWDPGSGAGLYEYRGGAWHKL